jgi:hypothetical protein
MNTRIVAWTILVTCAQALIGCGGGSSSTYNPVSRMRSRRCHRGRLPEALE